MKIRSIATIALALFLPLSIVACSEDSTGELNQDELSEELENEGLTPEQAECAAAAMIDADFTRSELDKLNAGEEDVAPEKEALFTEAVQDCVLVDIGN